MAGPQTKAEIEDALRAGLNALGWPGLRDHQIEPLRHILAGSDVLCILPTGGGKSALFQLPALCEEGTTLVLSPLIALMMDQVERLNQHGIAAATLNLARRAARLQSGYLYHYAFVMLTGVAALVTWYLVGQV